MQECAFFLMENLFVARSKSVILLENKSSALSDAAFTIRGEWMYYKFSMIYAIMQG